MAKGAGRSFVVQFEARTDSLRKGAAEAQQAMSKAQKAMGKDIKVANPYTQLTRQAQQAGGQSAGLFGRLFGKTAKSQITASSRGAFTGLETEAKKAGLAVAGAMALSAVGKKAKSFAQESTAAFKQVNSQVLALGKSTGGTVEQQSRLRGAFQLSGTDVGAATNGMRFLAKNLDAAAASSKKAASYTALSGVALKDSAGNMKPLTALLPQIADNFKNMPNGPQKTAAAMQLFGRQGQSMLPILNQGSEGIKKLGDQADKLGLTIGEKNQKQWLAANKAQREYDAALQGLKITVGANLQPVLTSLITFMSAHAVPAFRKILDIGLKLKDSIGKALAPSFKQAEGSVKAFSAAFKAADGDVTSSGFNGVLERIGGKLGELKKQFSGFKLPSLDLSSSAGAGAATAGVAGIALMLPKLAGSIPLLGKLGGAMKALTGPVGIVVSLFAAAYASNEQFRTAINALAVTLLTTIGAAMKQLLPVITQLISALLPLALTIFQSLIGVVAQLVVALAPMIAQLVKQLVPVFMQLVVTLLPIIVTLVKTLAPVFTQLIGAIAPLIPQLVGALLPVFVQLVSAILPPILMLVRALAPVFVMLIASIAPLIPQLIGALVPVLVQLIRLVLPPALALIRMLGSVFTWLVQTVIVPFVIPLIRLLVSVLGGIITIVVKVIAWVANLVTTVIRWFVNFKTNAIRPIQDLWASITRKFSEGKASVQRLAGGMRDRVMDVFNDFKKKAGGIWGKIVGAIGTAWEKLKETVKAPIRFVVNTVINGGIISAIRKVQGFFGVAGKNQLKTLSLPKGFRNGGRNDNTGYVAAPFSSTNRDNLLGFTPSGPFRYEGGEFITNRRATSRSMRLLNAINSGMIDDSSAPRFRNGGQLTGGGSGRWTDLFARTMQNAANRYGGDIYIVKKGFLPAGGISGSSHVGDAVDASGASGTRLWTMRDAMRAAGVAAWVRGPKQGFAWHIHGVPQSKAFGSAGGSGIYQQGAYQQGADGLHGYEKDVYATPDGKASSWLGQVIASVKSFAQIAADKAKAAFGALNPMEFIKSKFKSISDSAAKSIGGGGWGAALAKLPITLAGNAVSWAKGKWDAFLKKGQDEQGTPGTAGNMESWRSLVRQALARSGIGSGKADEDAWLRQIMTESSGNPNLVQSSALRDINVMNGDPARGLVQVPGVTWADFGKDMGSFIPNVYDPLKNLIVGMRAAWAQHGHAAWRSAIGKGHGYGVGTLSAAPGWAWVGEWGPELMRMRGGEQILSAAQSSALSRRSSHIAVADTSGSSPALSDAQWDELLDAIRDGQSPVIVDGSTLREAIRSEMRLAARTEQNRKGVLR